MKSTKFDFTKWISESRRFSSENIANRKVVAIAQQRAYFLVYDGRVVTPVILLVEEMHCANVASDSETSLNT